MRKLKPLAYKSVAQEMRSDKEDGGGGTAILATAKHNRVLSNSPPKRCVIMLYLVLFNLHRIWSVKVPRCGLFHRRFPTQRWSAFGRFYGVLGSVFQAEDMQTQKGTLGAFLYHWNGKSCGTVLIATNILYLFLSDFRGEPEQRPAGCPDGQRQHLTSMPLHTGPRTKDFMLWFPFNEAKTVLGKDSDSRFPPVCVQKGPAGHPRD